MLPSLARSPRPTSATSWPTYAGGRPPSRCYGPRMRIGKSAACFLLLAGVLSGVGLLACPSKSSGTGTDAHTGDRCVPYVDSGSRICNDFTIGKGPACDECVLAQCTQDGSDDECCHRGTLCNDPSMNTGSA
jgi:hypothetical protein